MEEYRSIEEAIAHLEHLRASGTTGHVRLQAGVFSPPRPNSVGISAAYPHQQHQQLVQETSVRHHHPAPALSHEELSRREGPHVTVRSRQRPMNAPDPYLSNLGGHHQQHPHNYAAPTHHQSQPPQQQFSSSPGRSQSPPSRAAPPYRTTSDQHQPVHRAQHHSDWKWSSKIPEDCFGRYHSPPRDAPDGNPDARVTAYQNPPYNAGDSLLAKPKNISPTGATVVAAVGERESATAVMTVGRASYSPKRRAASSLTPPDGTVRVYRYNPNDFINGRPLVSPSTAATALSVAPSSSAAMLSTGADHQGVRQPYTPPQLVGSRTVLYSPPNPNTQPQLSSREVAASALARGVPPPGAMVVGAGLVSDAPPQPIHQQQTQQYQQEARYQQQQQQQQLHYPQQQELRSVSPTRQHSQQHAELNEYLPTPRLLHRNRPPPPPADGTFHHRVVHSTAVDDERRPPQHYYDDPYVSPSRGGNQPHQHHQHPPTSRPTTPGRTQSGIPTRVPKDRPRFSTGNTHSAGNHQQHLASSNSHQAPKGKKTFSHVQSTIRRPTPLSPGRRQTSSFFQLNTRTESPTRARKGVAWVVS